MDAPGGGAEPAPSTGASSPESCAVFRDAMAFVAGYVAAKCRHIDATLGTPTCSASPAALAAVPSSWVQKLSRGQLCVPSAAWMALVESFEVIFARVMGATADQQPGILRRLTELLMTKEPHMDQRIARKLASTRLHLRLRHLNSTRAEGQLQSQRRAANQRRHHARSST